MPEFCVCIDLCPQIQLYYFKHIVKACHRNWVLDFFLPEVVLVAYCYSREFNGVIVEHFNVRCGLVLEIIPSTNTDLPYEDDNAGHHNKEPDWPGKYSISKKVFN